MDCKPAIDKYTRSLSEKAVLRQRIIAAATALAIAAAIAGALLLASSPAGGREQDPSGRGSSPIDTAIAPPAFAQPSSAEILATFELPFRATDVVFDPIRPYMYASDKEGRRVYFINLESGLIEKQFDSGLMPKPLAIAPDGSRLFVGLLTSPFPGHSSEYEGEGFIDVFDLEAQEKGGQFPIGEDPQDIIATSSGHLVVSYGSGPSTYIRVYDTETGAETGSVGGVPRGSWLTLHPSEDFLYADRYNTAERYDLSAAGGIKYRWESGTKRWIFGASPLGEALVGRTGHVYSVGETQETDMALLAELSGETIHDVAFDAARNAMFTGEGQTLRHYNLQTYFEIGSQDLGEQIDFVSVQDTTVYAVQVGETGSRIVAIAHPALDGATNTPPQASFSVDQATGRTTETDLLFDASATSDEQDPLAALQFRWDFDGDETWDTVFSPEPTFVKKYGTGGTKTVRLQVRDTLGLVGESEFVFEVAFEADPGEPGPAHAAFELPFLATDVAFDPNRPYAYVSDQEARKVYFVNLESGLIEKQFNFQLMPESLAITRDGSRLFAALLTRPHNRWDDGGGFIASFDLEAGVKDRQFRIAHDPFDIVATSDGHLVVSPGSGLTLYMRVFDAETGAETGSVSPVRYLSGLTLHPSEDFVFATARNSYGILTRYDLLPGGGIGPSEQRQLSELRLEDDHWASPLGDIVINRSGDIFAAGNASTVDMTFMTSLTAERINDMTFDRKHGVIFAGQGTALRYYDLYTYDQLGNVEFPGQVSFVSLQGETVYAMVLDYAGGTSAIEVLGHPALNANPTPTPCPSTKIFLLNGCGTPTLTPCPAGKLPATGAGCGTATPTLTPCPNGLFPAVAGGGCATPTPTPTPPSMSLNVTGVYGGSAVSCNSNAVSACTIEAGSSFTVEIVPDAIPAGGYSYWQTDLEFGTLDYAPRPTGADEISWDLGVLRARAPMRAGDQNVRHGDVSAFLEPRPLSNQTTALVTLDFECTTSDTLRLIDYNETPAGAIIGANNSFLVPLVGSMDISCEIPAGSTSPADCPYDVNGDGSVNIVDILAIARKTGSLIQVFLAIQHIGPC